MNSVGDDGASIESLLELWLTIRELAVEFAGAFIDLALAEDLDSWLGNRWEPLMRKARLRFYRPDERRPRLPSRGRVGKAIEAEFPDRVGREQFALTVDFLATRSQEESPGESKLYAEAARRLLQVSDSPQRVEQTAISAARLCLRLASGSIFSDMDHLAGFLLQLRRHYRRRVERVASLELGADRSRTRQVVHLSSAEVVPQAYDPIAEFEERYDASGQLKLLMDSLSPAEAQALGVVLEAERSGETFTGVCRRLGLAPRTVAKAKERAYRRLRTVG